DRLRVQMIRRGDGEHIEVWEITQDVVPRFVAEVALGRMAGPILERGGGFPGGLLRARGDGDEVELHRRGVAVELVEADARELAGDAEALEVGVGAEVNVAAEHAGADEGDFDGGFHEVRRAHLIHGANARSPSFDAMARNSAVSYFEV